MAQITAAMVKQLREMTDSPMMECKKALVEADGDMDAAVDVLRKNGLAKAAKKAGRETNEGAVAAFVSEDGKTGALLELSCETDFVGSNAKFTGFASKVAEVVATTEPADVDALLEKPMGEETVSSELTEMIHIMGENMKISRFAARKAENGALASYIHMGGKIGVLVEFAFEKAETAQAESFKTFAHDVALQVAAVAPICATRDQVPAETVEHEKQIYMAQAAESGKPEAIQEKMAVGRLEKFYKQSVLTEQEFIKDSSLTIKKYAEQVSKELSDTITVSGFPADHGQYAGNEEYEFAADRPYATVSVWWSGDPDNPSNDEAYKPSGGEVPTEDDNHRLLATWEIPAMNGTFKIGAGALDAHGAPMYLTAERPGWYVFVWRFEGDDRVSPASSRYDDAWERVRVLPPCESEKPCEPEKPETPPAPAEATTPNPRPSLPVTGGDVSLASVLAVSALAIGAILSIVVRWRRRYDRFKHWTMRWPIR